MLRNEEPLSGRRRWHRVVVSGFLIEFSSAVGAYQSASEALIDRWYAPTALELFKRDVVLQLVHRYAVERPTDEPGPERPREDLKGCAAQPGAEGVRSPSTV